MNEKELAEIEERAAKATPGPWEFDETNMGYVHHKAHYGLRMNSEYKSHDYFLQVCIDEGMEHNAAFIAHARQDVPALLAEVRRLTKERDEAWDKSAAISHDLIEHTTNSRDRLAVENARLRAALVVIAMRNIDGVYSAEVTADIARNALKGGDK